VLLIGTAVLVVLSRPVRMGLDLRGGTQVALEARDTSTRKANANVTDQALEVIRRRVDQLGVSEPNLQPNRGERACDGHGSVLVRSEMEGVGPSISGRTHLLRDSV
jgi:preprotein translocase subunit SecD